MNVKYLVRDAIIDRQGSATPYPNDDDHGYCEAWLRVEDHLYTILRAGIALQVFDQANSTIERGQR